MYAYWNSSPVVKAFVEVESVTSVDEHFLPSVIESELSFFDPFVLFDLVQDPVSSVPVPFKLTESIVNMVYNIIQRNSTRVTLVDM